MEVVADGIGRYPAQVEAAAYFTCLEALQNAAKHASAAHVLVSLQAAQEVLLLAVEDDGVGYTVSEPHGGTGLANLRVRVDSVGGTLTVDSAPGRGTRLRAVFPARGTDGA